MIWITVSSNLCNKRKHQNFIRLDTSLFLKAKMIAPACSAALPTIGSNIMLRKLTDKPHELDASCSISHLFFITISWYYTILYMIQWQQNCDKKTHSHFSYNILWIQIKYIVNVNIFILTFNHRFSYDDNNFKNIVAKIIFY